MTPIFKCSLIFLVTTVTALTCRENRSTMPENVIAQLHLKSGQLISCGPADKEFGTVVFETSCGDGVKKEFNTAMELLHSFEYDEAEKAFASIINKAPNCVMAYWGVAMCNFHPLWEPPTPAEL